MGGTQVSRKGFTAASRVYIYISWRATQVRLSFHCSPALPSSYALSFHALKIALSKISFSLALQQSRSSLLSMSSPKDLWAAHGHPIQGTSVVYVAVLLVAAILAYVSRGRMRQIEGKQPPWLAERVPYITNTYQLWTDMETFLHRAG